MSDPEPQPDQPQSADAAQPSPSPSPSPVPVPVPVPQPDQQSIDHDPLQQATPLQQQQQQQEDTELDNPDQEHRQSLPPFQPLFTLVTDSTTGATHHAHVHYIFSDDEPDLLTDALGQYSIQQQQHHQHQQQQQQTASSSSGSTSAKPSPPQPINNRAILLDLVPKPPSDPTTTSSSTAAVPSGYDVAWASSLSADWAVVSAKVSAMSADDNNNTDAVPTPARSADSDGGLMLRIEGVDLAHRPPNSRAVRSKPSIDLSSGSSSGVAQPAQQEDYGVIVDEFDKRMAVLRKVLEAGRERQLKMAVDAGGETGPQEPPAASIPGRPASHTSVGHDQPDNGPSGSRRPSNSSGVSGVGQQTGSKRLSGGSGGRAEWEPQPVG